MKKQYTLLSLLIVSVGFLAFENTSVSTLEKAKSNMHMQAAGGQTALTGAPGENNCTQCHNGTALDGTAENTVIFLDASLNPVTSYVAGNSYTVSVTMNSNPTKKGFSSVALDGTTANAGTFAGMGIGGTQDFTSASRHYVSHTATSNTDAISSWLWTWNAPAVDVGDVTFYVASNAANNNNVTTGDAIYLSQHVINSTAGIAESNIDNSFTAGYNVDKNIVDINFNYLSIGEMVFTLVDINGKSVFTERLGLSEIGENSEKVALPNDLESGIYVVHFLIGNKAMSGKISVQ